MTVSLILNLTNFVLTGYVLFWLLFLRKELAPGEKRSWIFRFFTTDSNILSAVASLVMAISEIPVLSGSRSSIPFWVIVLKFIGTSSVMLTFFTVLFFLGPLAGYKELYKKDGFHMHLVGPLLALTSFVIFEPTDSLPFFWFLLGATPEFFYALVYLRRVVFLTEANGGWPDFYYFTHNGKWKLSFLLMMLAGLAVSLFVLHGFNVLFQ